MCRPSESNTHKVKKTQAKFQKNVSNLIRQNSDLYLCSLQDIIANILASVTIKK